MNWCSVISSSGVISTIAVDWAALGRDCRTWIHVSNGKCSLWRPFWGCLLGTRLGRVVVFLSRIHGKCGQENILRALREFCVSRLMLEEVVIAMQSCHNDDGERETRYVY